MDMLLAIIVSIPFILCKLGRIHPSWASFHTIPLNSIPYHSSCASFHSMYHGDGCGHHITHVVPEASPSFDFMASCLITQQDVVTILGIFVLSIFKFYSIALDHITVCGYHIRHIVLQASPLFWLYSILLSCIITRQDVATHQFRHIVSTTSFDFIASCLIT